MTAVDEAYKTAAAVDCLLGAARDDAMLPVCYMRQLLRPLLLTLEGAAGAS